MSLEKAYVIGVDYGSDSARAVVVRARDGKECATAVKAYPRWSKGMYCDPRLNQYRQHPLDYIEALESAIGEALEKCEPHVKDAVVGLAFDTTGSTPCFVDKQGVPLALHEKFTDNPNAMFLLWKDHTSVKEATEINMLCKNSAVDYSAYSGGVYSSEWYWSKALHVLRHDEQVRREGYALLELCEWLPALVTGVTKFSDVKRSRCACGHKGMWNEKWGGFPPAEFFAQLHPALGAIRSRMSSQTLTAQLPVGHLDPTWAKRLGLRESVVVAGGAIDCHMGAVGAGIKEHTFVRVMGTSTCDVMVVSPEEMSDRRIRGICGQVDGSVTPGLIGLEAGQAAYGDVFAWFASLLSYPMKEIMDQSSAVDQSTKQKLWEEYRSNILSSLNARAANISPSVRNVMAVDWFNGRRTPDANLFLKGALSGLTLGTDASHVFRSLVEATAYGSRAIVERFRDEGVRIDRVIAVGGIAKKSPLVMQILSDVLNMPVGVCRTNQVCALGAAMFAATAAGLYDTIEAASESMCSGFLSEYKPNQERVVVYDHLYKCYRDLCRATESTCLAHI